MSKSRNNRRNRRRNFSHQELEAMSQVEHLHPGDQPPSIRNVQCQCNGDCGYAYVNGRAVQTFLLLDRKDRSRDRVQCQCNDAKIERLHYFRYFKRLDEYKGALKKRTATLKGGRDPSSNTLEGALREGGVIRDTKSGRAGVARYRTDSKGRRVLATIVPLKK